MDTEIRVIIIYCSSNSVRPSSTENMTAELIVLSKFPILTIGVRVLIGILQVVEKLAQGLVMNKKGLYHFFFIVRG